MSDWEWPKNCSVDTVILAYNNAKDSGWTQELEDIVYGYGWPFDFDFSINIIGSNLVRYINNNIDNEFIYWCDYVINTRDVVGELIPAINASDLDVYIKEELISYIMSKVVKFILE